MDGADLAALTETGGQSFSLKLFMLSMHCLWVYDYLLTLGDEIEYVWAPRRRSWMFVIFIANRYTPVFYLVWGTTIISIYTKPFCQHSKWLIVLHSTATTLFAQMAVTTRIYVVTGMNKSLSLALSALTATQLSLGLYSLVRAATRPAQQVPAIDLDAFKICSFQQWQLGERLFVSMSIAFDSLAFAIILFTARRPGMSRYPGMPSVLDTVLRNATEYFILMFLGQLLYEVLSFLNQDTPQTFLGAASLIVIPVISSRFILSLKKAGSGPTTSSSLPTIGLGPVSRVDGIPRISTTSDQGGVELDPIDCGSIPSTSR